jgi:hypothetical protein
MGSPGGWMMNGIVKTVVWSCFAAAIAYMGYSWYTYSGLYRLIVEWQLETFGSFSLKMTLIGMMLVLIVPVAIVGRLLGGPNLINKPLVAQTQGSPRLTALIGLLLLVASAGVGWFAYQKSQETITYEPVDLTAGQLPSTQHVVLTGIARTNYLMQYETKSGGTSTVHTYIPLTAATWRPGEPIAYFLDTNATVYIPEGGGRTFAFSRTTPPFKMTTQKALLVRNGLPGPIGEAYHKNSIAIADPPIVLDVSPDADFETYAIASIACALGGFFTLIASAVAAVRRRRRVVPT